MNNVIVGILIMFLSSINYAFADNTLIPREVLFGNPDKVMVKLSPDGKHITYLAPSNGVLNIWLAPINNIKNAKPITDDKERGIRNYFWSLNNKHILFMQDYKGDENFRLYSYDLASQKIKLLSPEKGVKTFVYAASIKHPDEIIIGLNERRPDYFDCYRLNLVSGKSEKIFTNNEFVSFVFDDDLNLRFAQKTSEDGGSVYYKMKDGELQPYINIPLEDADHTSIIGFKQNNDAFYMLDSRNRNTAALTEVNWQTGKSIVLAEDDKADIDIMTAHPTKDIIQAVTANYLKPEHKVIDKEIANDISFLEKAENGVLTITSRSLDDNTWIVAYYNDSNPVKYYKYDRSKHQLSFLFVNNNQLANYQLMPMKPLVIKARDGFNLVSYLTLPPEAKLKKPLPMVLIVHGGPWSRDEWGLNSQHQWLANRGYAVLSVNFRGSTGFGKEFLNAGNKQWGKKMHEDLLDAVNWTVKEEIADPKQVVIFGGSYGGYATLAGLTLTPDVFAAGVNIVGISNLLTFIKSIPEYWKPLIANMRERVGDWDTEEGRKKLAEVSPINHVHKITKPLLIAHGKHDPRVNEDESEQIVNSMRKKGIPVLYAYYEDEGHGFARPVNRLSFYAVTEQFLAKILGGRAEPIANALQGSSITLNGKGNLNESAAQEMIKQTVK
jgi:dipeptidyl aminopeptidase/acylaminoacyl peptidase